MYETESEIRQLQTLLDTTYKRSRSHLLSIHKPEWRLAAPELVSILSGVCVLNLATVSSLGQPLVSPVDGLFLGGIFWFGSANESVRFSHIRKNPKIGMAYTVGEEISITIQGVAHEIDTGSGNYERLHKYCLEIYGENYDQWGYWGNAPFAWIEPTRMHAIRMQHG